jgi:CheY-like chemotaxis protein
MTEPPSPPSLRVVVCDDDPVVRSVIGGLVTDLGGEVMAETDTAIETAMLVTRFRPDIVVLDMQLRHGTGREVLAELSSRPDPPRIVVFTAHDELLPAITDGIDVVRKPDFEGLSRHLASLPERTVERRRPTREVAWAERGPVDDPAGFSRDLMTARPGDVLVSVSLDGADADHVVDVLGRAVRDRDRLLRRSTDVLVLLVDAGDRAVPALRDRVLAEIPDLDDPLRSADVGNDPVAAFTHLDTE